MNINKLALACIATLSFPMVGNAEAVFLNTPAGFQIIDISPNGKWATGAYVDAATNTFGFRWNLESGKIDMLSSTEPSMAWCVSDDGVVSGNYGCTEVTDNGAPMQMVGYYKDGKWNCVEIPSGTITDALGYGITPDGQYISGSVEVNGVFTPYVWKNGKIDRSLGTGNHAMAYCISPDGQNVGGWAMTKNRTAILWHGEETPILFEDSPTHSYTPWNCGKKFTSDGKKMLYWGGWHYYEEPVEELYLYTVYDLETGERERVMAPSIDADLDFFGLSDNGLIVGETGGNGIVYKDGQYMIIDDYLSTRGVDIHKFTGFWGGDEYGSYAPISRVMAVTPDESVFALRYFGLDGQEASLVVKIDQPTHRPVTDFEGKQLEGLKTVALTWTPPVGTYNQGYNVYRDGKKINGFLPVQNKYYYQKNVEPGVYEYQIGTLNTSGQEVLSDIITVTVKDAAEPNAPMNLYGRIKGVTGAKFTWNEPLNGLVHKNYYDEGSEDLVSFTVYEQVEMEAAICFPSNEISQYADFKLSEVSFYPMGNHSDWKLNCYSRTKEGTLTLLYSEPINQNLILNQRNIVKLSEPLALPATGDLIVAIGVTTNIEEQAVLAAQDEKVTVGYSDLLRQTSQDEFFSMYDSSVAATYTVTTMSWAIDLGLEGEGFSAEDCTLTGYNVYLDDKKIQKVSTNEYIMPVIEEGHHVFGVEALYANGKSSVPTTMTMDIAYSLPIIETVNVTQEENTDNVIFEWAAPKDDDSTDISYTRKATSSNGIRGTSSNGYAYMAASVYPAKMFHSYGGYVLKSLRFYPLADALFTLMVYEEGELIYDVEVEDAILNEWNEIEVDEEIVIKDGKNYRYEIDCFDPEPEMSILAIDGNPSFSYYSDLVSVNNGESWSTLADAGVSSNWMMGMVIAEPGSKELDVEGYNVRVDGTTLNDELVKEPKYAYELKAEAGHRYRLNVDTKYQSRDKALRGTTNYFYLQTSGIEDVQIVDIKLLQGSNVLVAEGEAVKSMAIYGIDGKSIAASQCNTIDISNVATGVYLVVVNCEGKSVTYKIRISK